MQRGITKRTQINSSWTDIITASLVPVLQSMKTRNDGMEGVENQWAHSISPRPLQTPQTSNGLVGVWGPYASLLLATEQIN